MAHVIKPSGDARHQLAILEERLCISGRDEIELAAVIELADREERTTGRRSAERECSFQFGPLRLHRSTSGEQPVSSR
jgi:hypothetical protein